MKCLCTEGEGSPSLIPPTRPPGSTSQMRRRAFMPARRVEKRVKPATGGAAAFSRRRLVVVLGFDGSESAYRALDTATQLISDRTGNIVAVFVAHSSATMELPPE